MWVNWISGWADFDFRIRSGIFMKVGGCLDPWPECPPVLERQDMQLPGTQAATALLCGTDSVIWAFPRHPSAAPSFSTSRWHSSLRHSKYFQGGRWPVMIVCCKLGEVNLVERRKQELCSLVMCFSHILLVKQTTWYYCLCQFTLL